MENNKTIAAQARIMIGMTAFIVVVLFLLLSVSLWASTLKEVVRCSDFKTQGEAQQKYLTNTAKYKSLDANHDGIACNNLSTI